jgi:hypothetical protein
MQPPSSGDRKGCSGLSRVHTRRCGDSDDEDPPPAWSLLCSGGRSREAAVPRRDPRRRREPRRADPAPCVRHDLGESGCIGGHCLYAIQYGDGSYTIGFFAQDTLTIAHDAIKVFRFGCREKNDRRFGKAAAGRRR